MQKFSLLNILTQLLMTLVFDSETGAFHHKINDHLFDCHVSFVVFVNLLAVNFGDRIDVSCWELNINQTSKPWQLSDFGSY